MAILQMLELCAGVASQLRGVWANVLEWRSTADDAEPSGDVASRGVAHGHVEFGSVHVSCRGPGILEDPE